MVILITLILSTVMLLSYFIYQVPNSIHTNKIIHTDNAGLIYMVITSSVTDFLSMDSRKKFGVLKVREPAHGFLTARAKARQREARR